jgi:hypothetical protein
MKFLIVSILLAFSSVVHAQDIDRAAINEGLKNVRSVTLKHNGQEGVWFPKKDAEFLLDLVSTKLKLSLDIIDNQNIQIAALKSAVDGYKQSKDSYAELADFNRTMFDTAMKHLPELNPPEPSWYESPKATFIYGVVLGGAVVFGTTWLATQALDGNQ